MHSDTKSVDTLLPASNHSTFFKPRLSPPPPQGWALATALLLLIKISIEQMSIIIAYHVTLHKYQMPINNSNNWYKFLWKPERQLENDHLA